MAELYDVTIILKDPSVDKVCAALRNLRKMGVLFPTQLNSQSINGMATKNVVSQLKQVRDALVISRRVEIVKGEIMRSVDTATALREMEEKEAMREAYLAAEKAEEGAKEKTAPKVESQAGAAVETPSKDSGKKKKSNAPKPKTTKKKPSPKKKKPAKKNPVKKANNKRKAKNKRKRKAANHSKRQNRRKH